MTEAGNIIVQEDKTESAQGYKEGEKDGRYPEYRLEGKWLLIRGNAFSKKKFQHCFQSFESMEKGEEWVP